MMELLQLKHCNNPEVYGGEFDRTDIGIDFGASNFSSFTENLTIYA